MKGVGITSVGGALAPHPHPHFHIGTRAACGFSLFCVMVPFKTSFGQKGILLLKNNLKKINILSLCQKAIDMYFVCG